jgi:hypothetical protein
MLTAPPKTLVLHQPVVALDGLEAQRALLDLAHGKTRRIPGELLAAHVLHVYREADWPVQRAAMEALLRRLAFAERDGLRVAERPARAAVLGDYSTRRPREAPRGWRTVLEAIGPRVRASCDCPDFVRGSLGICKHVFVVLDDVYRRRRTQRRDVLPALPSGPRLAWNSIRPLRGAGDWLERVRFERGASKGRLPDVSTAILKRRFAVDVRGGSTLKTTPGVRLEQRRELVLDLLKLGQGGLALDPALKRLCQEEIQLLRRTLATRASAGPARATLRSLKRKLYPYQVAGVERFLASGRLLLADDMGLGKTAQAIACCHALSRTKQVQRGLIVVPASLKGQWLREWNAWTAVPVTLLDGHPGERARIWRATRSGFLIVNYEQVIRDLDSVQAWDPELVVLDEAQRIKNWATKTAACVKALRPDYRLVLTGTPMENRLEELASIFDWVDDHALEPKWRLVPWHGVCADGSREIVGARNLDTLRERIAPRFLRRLRSEVLAQLPPRTDTVVPLDLTSEQRDEHDALQRPIMILMQVALRRPLTQAEFLRLMQLLTTQRIIANGIAQLRFESVWPALGSVARPNPTLLESLGSPKLLQLRELLRALVAEQGRKVVVFSQWRRMLSLADWAVADVLADSGRRAVFFTGKERARRRTQNLVDFHDDPAVSVLFASDAGGVGLNLQRAASACINLELPWNPAVLEQRIGRIYRLGQEKPIDVYNLVSQGCIEARIANLVADKQQLFRGLFEGTSDEVSFEGSASFMAGLKQIVAAPTAEAEPAGSGAPVDLDASEGNASVDHEIDALVDAGDEQDTPSRPPAAALPALDANLLSVFSQLKIQTSPDGRMHIDAPPDAAAALAQLFSGLARMLESAGQR